MTTDLKRESKVTVHDLALWREAILSVLDSFAEDGSGELMFSKNEDELITSRMAFADATQNYVTDRIIVPPREDE